MVSERPVDTVAQADVAAWFDATYRKKGLRYLRPRRAYPMTGALRQR